MTQREKKYVEDALVKQAVKDGWLVRKVQWTGRRGAPDRVFMRGGRTVWIECKDPDGSLDEIQAREIERMRDVGQEVHVIYSFRQGLRLLRK
jgi:hypothetical protein